MHVTAVWSTDKVTVATGVGDALVHLLGKQNKISSNEMVLENTQFELIQKQVIWHKLYT